MLVCHSTAIVARRCDVGLDKVSHQQYSPAGGCRVRVIQRRVDDEPRRCCSVLTDGCRHLACITYTAVSDLPETRRAARRASTRERHGSHGRAAARHRERTIVHDGVARDVPFLGAASKRYRRRCTFSAACRSAGLFGVARTITYVADRSMCCGCKE